MSYKTVLTVGEKSTNRIADFYADRTIFITGSTGFVGKLLVEKLLRVTNVKKIYLLLRPKKGKTPQERFEDIFSNVLFDILKKQKPNAIQKVKIIIGDICEENLGIALEDRRILQNEIEFIFHSAATVRFDLSFHETIIMNTRGTKYVLELAKECKKLKCFIYVSTAYAYPEEDVLYEQKYPPPANPHDVIASMNWINDEGDEQFTKKLLGNCPNTYTFSKSLAEALVCEQFDKIPSVIGRLSLVIPTFKEPFPGWTNNLQGPMGIFVGAGKGVIRSMCVNKHSAANLLPADFAINGLCLAPWYFVQKSRDSRIYNIVSTKNYVFKWEEILEEGKYVIYNVIPFNGILWYPGGSMKDSRWIHNICFYLFQLFPAILIDLLLACLRYKPILYDIQRRIQKGNDLLEYYAMKSWSFSNNYKDKLELELNEKEKEVFPIDANTFNMRDYLTKCLLAVRRNNLKETDDMIPAAWRQMRIMYVIDRLAKIGFCVLAFYCFYHLSQILLNTFEPML